MKKLWHDDAWAEYIELSITNKKLFNKVNELIKSIDRNGYSSIGKVERLKGNLSSYYSARIDKKNRLVFKITDLGLEIYECCSHYGDK